MPFEYPVVFTRDAFAGENDSLRRALGDARPRAHVLVDDGVARATPGLVARVAAYAHAHDVALAAAPEIVASGEA